MNLKKNFLTVLVLLGMFLPVVYVLKYENDKKKEASINYSSASDPHAHSSVTIVYKTQLPDSLKIVLKKVVHDYDSAYHLQDTLFISDTSIATKYIGNRSNTIVAIGRPREVCLNKVSLQHTDTNRFRNAIAHELYHTLAGGVPVPITPYYYITQTARVISVSGLNFQIELKDSGMTSYSILEEAAAEACAWHLYIDYRATNPEYYNVGDLMNFLIDSNWVTPIDLINATRTSNPIHLLSKIINSKDNEVNSFDVAGIMDMFNLAWTGQSYEQRIRALDKWRKYKK